MKKGHNFIYNYALSDRGISANQQLNALKLALTSQGTPPQLYSLNGYAEDRVCLDFHNFCSMRQSSLLIEKML